MNDSLHDGSATPYEPAGEPFGEWDEARPEEPRKRDGAQATLDLARLAEWLPRLGTVLWLERRKWRTPPPRVLAGSRGMVLLEHAALAPLGRCGAIAAHTAVTSQGPREWLSFHDAGGNVGAKLFLLPDTDYLAWDELTATARLEPIREETPAWQAHAAFLRGALARIGGAWRASVVQFETGRLPWLRTLDVRAPLRLSLIGLELARAIARSEGADLASPLHSA